MASLTCTIEEVMNALVNLKKATKAQMSEIVQNWHETGRGLLSESDRNDMYVEFEAEHLYL
jgi:hypothetical protein